jgi:hypothetical protein
LTGIDLHSFIEGSDSLVTAVSTQLRNVNLQNVTIDDLSDVTALVANWDTLGWVHFQKDRRPKTNRQSSIGNRQCL